MSQYPCFNQPPDSGCAATPTYEARECVSYVAWRGSLILGHEWPTGWGNAGTWPAQARAAGFVVNTTPAVNTIMCLPPNTNGAGKVGHVGWVVAVEAQSVVVQEYDFLVKYGYDERDFPIAGAEFIHLPAPPVPKEDDPRMFTIINFGAPGIYILYDDHVLVGIYSPPDVAELLSLPQCHGQRTLNAAMLPRFQAVVPK